MYKPLPEDFSKICDLRSFSNKSTTAEQLRWIKNSVLTNNYYIFENNLKKPTGYIILANITRETLARLNRIGSFPQYYYEWNEGYITLVLDVFTTEGLTLLNRKQLCWVLRQKKALAFVRNKKLAFYIRRNWLHRKMQPNVAKKAA